MNLLFYLIILKLVIFLLSLEMKLFMKKFQKQNQERVELILKIKDQEQALKPMDIIHLEI